MSYPTILTDLSGIDVKKLLNDEHYYGLYGKQFLSNSDIDSLLYNPAKFKYHEDTVPMLMGSYFNDLLIQKDKSDTYEIVDASTRNTNIYKSAVEASGKSFLLLRSEADIIESAVEAMLADMDFYDIIKDAGSEYEVPGVGMIGDLAWKSKCDIKNSFMEKVFDLKTTSDLDKFKSSAYKYNYDSQAWVYEQLHGYKLTFLVIEKGSNRRAIFECSDEFLERGREKVFRAMESYNRFFGLNPTDTLDQYHWHQVL